MLYRGKRMTNTKVKISKKQAKELVQQLLKDQSFMSYKGKLGYYYSFMAKKSGINILIYEMDKKYYLEIISPS